MSSVFEFLNAAYPWVLIGSALAVAIAVINAYSKAGECSENRKNND